MRWFLLISVLFMPLTAYAQNSALAPQVRPTFFNASGTVAGNGFLCTTQTGTNTSLLTYQDSALTTPNQNPIHLNGVGRAVNGSNEVSIFIQAQQYRFSIYAAGNANTCNGNPVGALLNQIDNVYDLALLYKNSFASQFTDQTCHASQVTGSDAGAKIATCINALPASGGIVDATGFQGAQTLSSDPFTSIGSKPVQLMLGAATFTMSTNVTIPLTLRIIISPGGSINQNGHTLTTLGGVFDMSGTNAPFEFGGQNNLGGAGISLMKFGPYGSPGGGYFTSTVDNSLMLLAGGKFNGTTYVAESTSNGDWHLGPGLIEFHSDSGLTVGNTYSPTLRFFCQVNECFLHNGNAGLPALASIEQQTTGFYFVTAGVGFAGGGVSIGNMTTTEFQPGTANIMNLGDVTNTFKSISFGVNPAQSGLVRGPSNFPLVVARNAANTLDINVLQTDSGNNIFIGNANAGNIDISPGTGFAMVLNNFPVTQAASYSIGNTPALTGEFRGMAAVPQLTARNNGNTADINLVSTDASDNIFIGNGNAHDLNLSTGSGRFVIFNKVRTAAAVPANFAANFYIQFEDLSGNAFFVPAMNAGW